MREKRNATASSSTSPSRDQAFDPTPQPLSFSRAIACVAEGATITKLEWLDDSICCKMRWGFLMLHRDKEWFQWIISEGDMLGDDWIVLR